MTEKIKTINAAKEFSGDVAKDAHTTKKDAENVISTFLGKVSVQLERGNAIKLPGIGTFKPATRAARVGRNPRTGEVLDIPARKTIKYKPAKVICQEG